MPSRKELLEQVRALDRAGFVARHPNLFLVIRHLDEDPSLLAFATGLLRGGRARSSGSDAQILAVTKAPGNPYADRISIGRARNCDLVLRHRSISKLHAHIHQPLGGTEMHLIDAGSRNGTLVNGAPLAAHRPHPLVPDDVLQFGSVPAELVDAAGLFDLLRAS